MKKILGLDLGTASIVNRFCASTQKKRAVFAGRASNVISELIPYGCTTLRISEFPLVTR